MLEKVVSGGQTGADQAGWRAARAAGIPTGGWMPKGYRTEGPGGKGDAFHPEFSFLFDAAEHESPEYPPRTEANILDSDLTLVFISHGKVGPGTGLTFSIAKRLGRPTLMVSRSGGKVPETPKSKVVDALGLHDVRVLNVAGNRASTAPGVGGWVEFYLGQVFSMLKGTHGV